jgi:hypothetical protein
MIVILDIPKSNNKYVQHAEELNITRKTLWAKEICEKRGLFHIKLPNFVVEWLTLLLRIREAPGLNLGPEIGYLD